MSMVLMGGNKPSFSPAFSTRMKIRDRYGMGVTAENVAQSEHARAGLRCRVHRVALRD